MLTRADSDCHGIPQLTTAVMRTYILDIYISSMFRFYCTDRSVMAMKEIVLIEQWLISANLKLQ